MTSSASLFTHFQLGIDEEMVLSEIGIDWNKIPLICFVPVLPQNAVRIELQMTCGKEVPPLEMLFLILFHNMSVIHDYTYLRQTL